MMNSLRPGGRAHVVLGHSMVVHAVDTPRELLWCRSTINLNGVDVPVTLTGRARTLNVAR